MLDNSDRYSFPQYRSGKVRSIPSHQYVHRSASIFIRKLEDEQGKVILVGIENYRNANNENKFRDTAKKVLKKVFAMVAALLSDSEPNSEAINSGN